jgi:hypothetical protein
MINESNVSSATSRRQSSAAERPIPPPNVHGIFRLYALYFKVTRWFGVYPLYYDGTERFEVKVAGFGLAIVWWILNLLYVAVYGAKNPALLVITHRTNYKYETMRNSHMFQLQVGVGFMILYSLYFSQSAKMKVRRLEIDAGSNVTEFQISGRGGYHHHVA